MTALVESWACRNCDAHGTGTTSDRAADKHTRTTGHTTRTTATPKEPTR